MVLSKENTGEGQLVEGLKDVIAGLRLGINYNVAMLYVVTSKISD